ncbi:MAG TPA: non-canonical purine NTP pyrophosphatase, partial [Anaerolineae bacterium]|nr:non-canonical purine NTP pyrophosphatase [Anaerolineae bacterium]
MVTAAAHRGIARLLLGTRNPAKIAIVRAALAPLPLTLLTLHELEIDVEVVEDGRTTQENAVKKARAYLAVS